MISLNVCKLCTKSYSFPMPRIWKDITGHTQAGANSSELSMKMCCYYSNQRAQQAMRHWLTFVAVLIKLLSNVHPDFSNIKTKPVYWIIRWTKKSSFFRTSNWLKASSVSLTLESWYIIEKQSKYIAELCGQLNHGDRTQDLCKAIRMDLRTEARDQELRKLPLPSWLTGTG